MTAVAPALDRNQPRQPPHPPSHLNPYNVTSSSLEGQICPLAAVRRLRLPHSRDRMLLPGRQQTKIVVSTQPTKLLGKAFELQGTGPNQTVPITVTG